MAREKKSKGPVKPKTMFKPYDEATVPDCMPLPTLLRVHKTGAAETPVPKLNRHQQSWIFDVALRNVNLAAMDGTEAKKFYAKVKTDAFDAKPFKHKPNDIKKEVAEEASLAKQITKKSKNGAATGEDDDDDDEGGPASNPDDDEDDEDAGGRASILRGFPKAGWCMSIQKSLSNKRGADLTKRKKTGAADSDAVAPASASALSKIFGLAAYTGRDLFRQERHEEISARSKLLPGSTNAGGKFRKAEAELWAEEDPAKWESAAATEEDVDWEERQKLIPGGIQHMVETLNSSGKFRPHVAIMLLAWLDENNQIRQEWVEAVPEGVHMRQRFDALYPDLTGNAINALHSWAKKPLLDYAAARDAASVPIFPIAADLLDETTPKVLAQIISAFIVESYEAAFGAGDIPWADIANDPDVYYDTAKVKVVFNANGLDAFKGKWHDLAAALASGAGNGSSGFFRKKSLVGDEDEDERAQEELRLENERAEKTHLEQLEKERLENEEKAAENARLKEEHIEKERVEKTRLEQLERERLEEERVEKTRLEQLEKDCLEKERVEKLRREEQKDKERLEKEEKERQEKERLENEEKVRLEKERLENEEKARLEKEAKKADKGGKRKAAEAELEQDDTNPRRTSRARKTPAQAEEERQLKAAATVGKKAKPGYEYVPVTSPQKLKPGRRAAR
ncbi:hypothetical protein C8F01DRAFT_1231731 [Mycena amicta]|nr:hypothetical protein C8F01DRAFT_1231731 [Mycena amicta]